MSMCFCEGCDAPIDSDEDPECFVVGNLRGWIQHRKTLAGEN